MMSLPDGQRRIWGYSVAHMAEVASTRVLSLESRAPEFELRDAQGELLSLDDVRGAQGLLIMFVCNHCPYVVHLAPALADFARKLEKQGIGVVAINSNDAASYPADAPDKMVEFADKYGWDFPYLVDEDQSVAKAYVAACTPDFYLFDGELKLTYCGQFDSSRPKNGEPVTGEDLRAAVEALVGGEAPLEDQQPSTGCSIKWKPGNEPV
jgi:peroxiredoxin